MRIKLTSSLAALLLLASALGAMAADSGRIAFREQVSVLGDEMLLGELADLSGECAALAGITLGRSPEPGKALELSRAELLNKLSVAVPLGAVEVSCPPQVVALRRHQVVGRAQMLEALKSRLEQRLAADGGEVSVSGFRVAEEPLVPEGRLELAFELPQATERCLGNVNLPLIIKVEGSPVRKLRLAAAVVLRREVAVAAREIGRHEVLGAEDVSLVRREVSGLEPIFSLDEAVGKRASRRIEAGATIGRRDLEEPPVVAKGASVTILLESGPLFISARGTVCETGRRGETVRVLNADSKREVLAVVVDGATVRIPFER